MLQAEKDAAGEAQQSSAPGGIWQQAAAWFRGDSHEQEKPKLSPQQQAILAATKREQQLDRMVGLPAQPPPAPQGLYIYGSVGSGKSELCAMFFQMLEQKQLVPLLRRMHFNSAMLGGWLHLFHFIIS